LMELFPRDRWDLLYVNYTNVAVYPLVWAVRKWRKIFPQKAGKKRMEDERPAEWLNLLLRRLFVSMAFWRVPFPFGVSLILIARRRAA
jgi:hypothetical protein